MIFQLQLALFQAAQLELVVVPVQDEHVYDRIEVAMFNVEFDQATLDILDVIHEWCSKQYYVFDGMSARPEAL